MVLVSLPGAAQGRLPAHVPGAQPGRPARFASVIALAPAGWVWTSGQRSWSRCSVSPSPSGNTTFRRALSCTSGRSSTASTRLARRPGVMCPDSARSDAQAVPPGPWEVTSAAATVCSSSLISTYRCSSCLAGGTVLAPSCTVRSHGSQRSSGGGAETAPGRAAGPVPVTVPRLLGLLTELTACRSLEQTCALSLTITSRHCVPARDEGPHTWGGGRSVHVTLRNQHGAALAQVSALPGARSRSTDMPAEPHPPQPRTYQHAGNHPAQRTCLRPGRINPASAWDTRLRRPVTGGVHDGDLRLWVRPPKRATLIVGTCLGRST